ncbi:MAG: response regulator [Cyclobacteriaceae bacterium]|nr:response regulator [Cyclobacteriaceae bacterium]
MSEDKLILIIDDDILDIKIMLRALKDTNFTCRTYVVNNGKEALEYLVDKQNEKPWLIFSDINMPIMNGVEFLNEKLKYKHLVKIPVIIFTTSNTEVDRNNCLKAGASGYMVKPIEHDNFKKLINSVKVYWQKSEYYPNS